MKSLHRITGILVAIFVIAHLFNHSMAIFGISTHQSILDALRKVYRIPIVEFILVSAFVFQSITGIQLFLRLRKKKYKSVLEQLKMYSGLVLGLFILQHISATIGLRLYHQLDTNFYFAANVVVQKPMLFYFIPYYFLGILAFGMHLASIHREKMSIYTSEINASIQFWLILLFFFAVSILILYTFTGGFYPVDIPEEYNIY